MKTFSIIIIGFLTVIACKSEKSVKQEINKTVDSSRAISFKPPKLDENYYRELFKYQQKIIQNPSGREEKERYIFNAFFPENNTLLSFGSARRTNPQTKQAIPYPLQKRAALIDARRWGTYGLLWINNDFRPDFGKISDIHTGETQEVYTFENGDSLIIVLANKVH